MPPPPPEVVLRATLAVRAPLPEGSREALVAEVERIFRDSGIRLEWKEGRSPAFAVITVEDAPARPIITGCRRGLHDHRLGLTRLDVHHIILWASPIRRAAVGDWDSRSPPALAGDLLGRAMGRVLAHELAHLLLGPESHRRSGLMSRSLTRGQLTAPGRLGWSAKDRDRLRAAAHRLLSKSGETSS